MASSFCGSCTSRRSLLRGRGQKWPPQRVYLSLRLQFCQQRLEQPCVGLPRLRWECRIRRWKPPPAPPPGWAHPLPPSSYLSPPAHPDGPYCWLDLLECNPCPASLAAVAGKLKAREHHIRFCMTIWYHIRPRQLYKVVNWSCQQQPYIYHNA